MILKAISDEIVDLMVFAEINTVTVQTIPFNHKIESVPVLGGEGINLMAKKYLPTLRERYE